MTALAHTLPADLALHTPDWSPPRTSSTTEVDVDVLVGGDSPPWLHDTARAAAAAYGAACTVIPGQGHDILWHPQALVPHL